ncbi:jg10725 [Pararge aegeria aegeria]|uniref:Jg10725 protein n=2 Tax=Pararge aegeria TaxID=116150 RepID=A0A8S4RFM5_9NEOP|nr:jg10725 [Pararge aegeria aegeria]
MSSGVQVNPRTGSRLKSEVQCDGPAPPASPRFARHNHNHLNHGPASVNAGPSEALVSSVCVGTCSRCACCGCTLRDAAARHEQRVAASERLERANLEWKQVAVVADRALLAVFVLVTTIATAAILLPQLNNLHVGNTPLKPPT